MKLDDLNPRGYEVDLKTQCYLMQLCDSLTELEKRCQMTFFVTSGLRSKSLQQRLIDEGKSHAPLSRHLLGAAADVLDKDGKLAEWCRSNLAVLEELGLWCENFSYTKGWVHFQILPPGSGRRVFVP